VLVLHPDLSGPALLAGFNTIYCLVGIGALVLGPFCNVVSNVVDIQTILVISLVNSF